MSSEINDFAVKVELDASDYDAQLGKLEAKNKQLEESLGALEKSFEGSNKSTKENAGQARKATGEMDKYMLSIGSVVKGLIALGGLTAGGKALLDMSLNSAKGNAELGLLSKNLGMSANNLRNWGRAVTEMGGDADSMTNIMMAIRDKITEFQVTGNPEILKGFNTLEIAMLKDMNTAEDMEEIFLSVADALKRMASEGGDSYQKAKFMADVFQIDPKNFDRVMLKGREGITTAINAQKELHQLSEADIMGSMQSVENIGKIANLWDSITSQIGTGLNPALQVAQDRTISILEYFAKGDGADGINNLTTAINELAKETDAFLTNAYNTSIIGILDVIEASKGFYDRNITGALDAVDSAKEIVTHEKSPVTRILKNGIDMSSYEKIVTDATGINPFTGERPVSNKFSRYFSEEEEEEEEEKKSFDLPESRKNINEVMLYFDDLHNGLSNSVARSLEDGYLGFMDAIDKNSRDSSDRSLSDAVFKGLEKFELSYGRDSLGEIAKLIDVKQNSLEEKLEDKDKSAIEQSKMTNYSQAYGVPSDKKDRANEAMKFFINNGYTSEQASGIVGNLIAESGLNTQAEGDKGFKGGSSYGIAQWRESRLKQFEKIFGKHVKDASFHEQLQFILWELQNTHQSANRGILNSNTVEGASSAFTTKFEVPANKEQVAINRFGMSNSVFRNYNDSLLSSGGSSSNGLVVAIDNITIQTSSSTMKGTASDFAQSLSSNSNLNQLVGSQR